MVCAIRCGQLPNLGAYRNRTKIGFWWKPRRFLEIELDTGEEDMGNQGKKDKGNREQQKKPKLTPKEKRQLKREKKK